MSSSKEHVINSATPAAQGLFLGPPRFEGFEVIQTVDNEESDR
ncbi:MULTISPECIES: hypothetical protein [unclassified Halomonas]|nr:MULTISPECIES: hypothetical protein [unclassified Halomonas]MDT0501440.1 hypothetical protein [Halomonas sp. PAR7]MDT0512886.1 hypothetical protein [Halomonas sp. LES1]MDT0591289.1 hypothetical protein [Halomonas sp. PAR8]